MGGSYRYSECPAMRAAPEELKRRIQRAHKHNVETAFQYNPYAGIEYLTLPQIEHMPSHLIPLNRELIDRSIKAEEERDLPLVRAWLAFLGDAEEIP